MAVAESWYHTDLFYTGLFRLILSFAWGRSQFTTDQFQPIAH